MGKASTAAAPMLANSLFLTPRMYTVGKYLGFLRFSYDTSQLLWDMTKEVKFFK